jgi:hypothetical protein
MKLYFREVVGAKWAIRSKRVAQQVLAIVALLAGTVPTPAWSQVDTAPSPGQRLVFPTGSKVLVGARVDGHEHLVRAIADPNSSAGEALDLALIAFRRCNDVTRMVMPGQEIAALERADHLTVTVAPPVSVGLAIPNYQVRLASLVVPLAGQHLRPDWYFYCRSSNAVNSIWGVYRWRGADTSMLGALRGAAKRLTK